MHEKKSSEEREREQDRERQRERKREREQDHDEDCSRLNNDSGQTNGKWHEMNDRTQQ